MIHCSLIHLPKVLFIFSHGHFHTKSQVHDYLSGTAANKNLRPKSWTLSCISKHHRDFIARIVIQVSLWLGHIVKNLFSCKTHSVINITHQNFVLNGRPATHRRISTMILCPLTGSLWQQETMCTDRLLFKGHLHCRLSIKLQKRTHVGETEKTI